MDQKFSFSFFVKSMLHQLEFFAVSGFNDQTIKHSNFIIDMNIQTIDGV